MPSSTPKEDLRSRRSRQALFWALEELLRRRAFAKITVQALCEKSTVSRSAFYAHYDDKYDLLRHWLSRQRMAFCDACRDLDGAQAAALVLSLLRSRASVWGNLLSPWDAETSQLLAALFFPAKDPRGERLSSRFAAGGLLFLLEGCRAGKALAQEGAEDMVAQAIALWREAAG
ncbi:MAG: TetR/AcrR family transcriptional regulator [Oscillospiraceae bacterium]|nr:TetR/AcrR family transcriptional regulator [Oscillospiraceae bacterium]